MVMIEYVPNQGDGIPGMSCFRRAFNSLPLGLSIVILAGMFVVCPCMFADSNRVFGLDHIPIGQAILEPGVNHLTLMNAGGSGADGLRTHTPGWPVTWGVRLAPVDPMLDNTLLEITDIGAIEEDRFQTLSTVSIRRIGPQTLITPNFSEILAGSLVVDYYFDGNRVLREEYANPVEFTLVSSESPQSFLKELLRLLGLYRVSFGWANSPMGVTVQSPQGLVVQVHEVKIIAQDIPVSLEGFVSIDMRVANIPSITITQEWTELSACPWCIPGDLNRDGMVNLQDVAILAGNWLECGDPKNATCSWTAQQSQEGLDRTVSVVVCEAATRYREGMSRRQFFDELYPSLDVYGAPDWVHKVADILWDILAPPGM